MNTINFKVDDDGVAVIEVDLRDRSMNVITPEFLDDLSCAIDKVESDDAVVGAIIASGKNSFIAGADLKDLVTTYERTRDVGEIFDETQRVQTIIRRMETCGKPFAAAINGIALGGGFEICLGCHYRVASNSSKALVGLPEVTIGLMPGAGGTQRLPRLVGVEAAIPILTTGRHLTPVEAFDLGAIDEVVALGEERAAARKWLLDNPSATARWDQDAFKVPGGAGIDDLAIGGILAGATARVQKVSKHNYPAPIAILSAVYEGTVLPLDKALRLESKYFATLLANPVSRNMMRTLFVNKNSVSAPQTFGSAPVAEGSAKLGVLGAGMMGAGIAYVSAAAGIDVALLDTSIALAEKGKDYARDIVSRRLSQNKITEARANRLLERIGTTVDYGSLKGCDLVIEAVFENREIKADVTRKAEAELLRHAVFASNTSTLPITGLAKASSRPAAFVGLHFFSPVDRMPLVEIIVGAETSDETVQRALAYVRQLRKIPIVVNDSRGFYTSRVFGTYTKEGAIMLAEGINPALIENVARSVGMPVGPLAVTDEVSIELNYHVMMQAREDLGSDYVPSLADPLFEKFVVELERPGKKAGKGYYDYPKNGKKRLWPGLSEHYPLNDRQPDAKTIGNRLLFVQALETVRCLDENVLRTPIDADIGSVFGWGFPKYTGGTISFIDTMGARAFVEEADRLASLYGDRFDVPVSLRSLAERDGTYYGTLEGRERDAQSSAA